MWVLDKLLTQLIKRGELIVVDHQGGEHRYGTPIPGKTPVKIRLNHKSAVGHIVAHPQVGAAEVYMDGRMDVIEGDIRDLILLVHSNAPAGGGEQALKPKGALRKALEFTAGKLDGVNWKSKSRRNAEHTYNLTRRLYELFLDEDRQYTCAYFLDPADSLEKAQLDKKAHLAAKLHLKPGMRVLDIGCGWGGLALYLHRHYGVEVLGVALAPDQIAFCKERAEAEGVADKVKFELKDYRDVEGPFDRIISVGLIEHLGQPHYPGFFKHTRGLLAEDGVMVSHCCGRMGMPGVTDKFTRKYIFPGGYIPALSELVTEAERNGLIVSDVEAVRYHYALTLKHWYERTVAARDEIVQLYDERFYRMWLFYLAGAESSFIHGSLVNWQLQYLKRRDAIPMVRDYLFEEEHRLRTAEDPPEWHLAQAAE
jgi:cyclopropane-fatty-acyl-phospholipid synthase